MYDNMSKILSTIHRFTLFVFVFLLPWQPLWIMREVYYGADKWTYGTIGIYACDIMLLIWIALSIFFHIDAIIKYIFTNRKIVLSAMAISLWSFLSIMWAHDRATAFYTAIILSLAIDLFFLIQIVPISIKKLSTTFIASLCIQSIIGLIQFFTQQTYAQKFLGLQHHDIWYGGTAVLISDTQRWIRAYGGMSHPNILGGMLVIGLILTLWIIATRQKNSIKTYIYSLSSIAILSMGIIVTFSRTAWLAAGISIFIFMLHIHTRTKIKKLIAPLTLISTLFLLFILLLPQLFFARAHDTQTTHNSFGDRKIYFTHARAITLTHPLRGTGIGNYTNSVFDLYDHTKPIWYYQPVHNIYFLITAEIGIIGFILLCIFFFTVFYDIFIPKKEVGTEKFTFFLIVFTFLFIGLFDHWPWTAHTGIMTFFLFTGLLHIKKHAPIEARVI